jgi:hypothetical protein
MATYAENFYSDMRQRWQEFRGFNPDQPRDPDGKFASGSGASAKKDPLAEYTSKFHFDIARSTARQDIENGRADQNPLLQGIREQTVNKPLYRGLQVFNGTVLNNNPNNPTFLLQQLVKTPVGSEFQIPPSSFTTAKSVATSYAGRFGSSERWTPTVLAVERGANGITLSKYLPDAGGEREVISGGFFKVLSHTYSSDGTHTIFLRQTGVH